MRAFARVVGGIVSVAGLLQVVLGIVFWTGHALTLIPVHMLIGTVFVAGLWTLVAVGVAARVPVGASAGGFVWGLVVLILGMTQAQILPGPAHWIVKVVHLIVGLIAMRQSRQLNKGIDVGRDSGAAKPGRMESIQPVRPQW